MSIEQKTVVIAGGGFFGCSIALMLHRMGWKPIIIEESERTLAKASQFNQARVHGGYHYPRSLMTAYRSRHNYERFRSVYREAIVDKFTKIYAVSKYFSKVTASQFEVFMNRVGAPLKEPSSEIRGLFDRGLTEKCWVCEECAFDYSILRTTLEREIEASGIDLRLGTTVERVVPHPDGALALLSDGSELPCEFLFNSTYSGINRLTSGSDLPIIPLKHELAEMALIELPPELSGISVTMMCGPFFSFMPYPSLGLTTLSHVRYTPHTYWLEDVKKGATDAYIRFDAIPKISNYELMIADASRYIPSLRRSTYRNSLWTTKTLLPINEGDDGRPILFRRDPKLPTVIHVMGGKIDNIFDVEDELEIMMTT